jgi:biotin carboxyl carrier protein
MKRLVDGQEHEFPDQPVEIRPQGDLWIVRTPEGWKSAAVLKRGAQVLVSYKGRQYVVEPVPKRGSGRENAISGEIRATMPGLVVSVSITQGAQVQKGEPLIVLEAMKTQIPLLAPFAGQVQTLFVRVGQQVKANEVLAVLEKTAND